MGSALHAPRTWVDGQELVIPSAGVWSRILPEGEFEGLALPLPSRVRPWLTEYAAFEVTRLAIHRSFGPRWNLVPLLRLNGDYLRVHYENVICEHCERRCGPSATPDFVLYPSAVAQARWSYIMSLRTERCPHCRGELRRTHTLWLHGA